MSYKANPELLRNTYNKKWNINLPYSKYTNLAIFIKIKYYLFWFLAKLDFYIISYKVLEINNKYRAFIYYYGNNKKSLLVDKYYKKILGGDIKKVYKIKLSINLFNIINFLPGKVLALNRELRVSVKQAKKFTWIKDLIYIINICTYAPNTKLLGAFLIKTLCSLRKQWVFIKITSNMIKKILPYRAKKIKGIKFAIAGKINGRNRKKTIIKSFGRLSTQNLSQNIKYSLSTSYNIYGAFSIKIWIVSLQNKH